MTEAEQVMKRCQIGTRNHDEANNLHAECYRVIGKLLAEHAMREVQRLGQEIEQEPVAMLERDPSIGRLRVTYENAVTELDEGVYPLCTKPQIEVGCAECGVNGGHALYCVACAEKFVGGYKDSGVPAVETGLEQVSPDTPPQRTERNFCERCGKRTKDIHTCTPPRENT